MILLWTILIVLIFVFPFSCVIYWTACMGLALPFSGVCSSLQDAVRLHGVVFKALFKRSFISSSFSFSPSHHTVAAQNSCQFSRLPLWLHAFVCVLFSARNVLTTPSPSGEYTLVLCWPFSDTACFLLALLTFPGKVLCILICTFIMIICFSARICILQGQKLNLVSSLFLTPTRISTGTVLEWKTLLISNTYWSLSVRRRLCWYCRQQMAPSAKRRWCAAVDLVGWPVPVELTVGTAESAYLSLLRGGRRGWGLGRSAQSSAAEWRLLGSLLTRLGQWQIILCSEWNVDRIIGLKRYAFLNRDV